MRPWLLRLYRLLIVAAVIGLLRYQGSRGQSDGLHPPPLEMVRRWFPEAARLGRSGSDWGIGPLPVGSYALGGFDFKPDAPARITFRAAAEGGKVNIDAVQLRPVP